jgi:hypothetical protein
MMLARTTLVIFAVFISHPALAELSDDAASRKV